MSSLPQPPYAIETDILKFAKNEYKNYKGKVEKEAYIDYMEFRVLLESKAAGLAAERATEYDRQIIRSKFDAMAASHDEDDPNVDV